MEFKDPRFNDYTPEEWKLLSEFVYQDAKREFESRRDLAEYVASFINREMVAEIRKSRADAEMHSFADDQEFEEQVKNGSYRNDPYVKAIQKIRADANLASNNDRKKVAGPVNLSDLKKLMED